MGKRSLATGEMRRVTRRTLLSGAAAAGAASVIRPPAGLAAAGLRGQSVLTRELGGLSGLSPAIQAARTFSLVGITWTGPAAAHIELRTRGSDGRWSPWVTASALGTREMGNRRAR